MADRQIGGDRRADDLSPVGDSHQPGRPAHLRPEVGPVALVRLAGVQSHPHLQGDPLRPLFAGQASLGSDRRRHRLPGPGERRPEPIPSGEEQQPAHRLQRLPHNLVVDG
jgi:hypothetical protein